MKKTYIAVRIMQLRVMYAIIATLLVLNIVMSLIGYKLQLTTTNLAEENESLKGLVEFKSSVISDLEENLRERSNK